MLQGAEESAENILFCTDEHVLCAIEEHDMDDINVNPSSREVPLFLIFWWFPAVLCCVQSKKIIGRTRMSKHLVRGGRAAAEGRLVSVGIC